MERENIWITTLTLILIIPWTFQAMTSVSQTAKKKEPIKDCTKNKTLCQNSTQTQAPLVNQTVTVKPKLAEFQINAQKVISISKDDLNDLLEVYMDKLAENAATIKDKEIEITQLHTKDQTDDELLIRFQELNETCGLQNISNIAALKEKEEEIKSLKLKVSTYEGRLKRKQHLLSQFKKQNATNVERIYELKARVVFFTLKLREKRDDLLADWEATTNSCLPYGKVSAVHLIELPDFRPFLVPCEGLTEAGPGWTVIQRRMDGSVDFYRNWDQYRKGFGKLNGEFFIGLEKLHRLTTFQPHELYILLGLFNGTFRYAFYDDFLIGNETEGYVMKLLGNYQGNASDAMRTHDKMKFSTYDRDHDEFTHMNCAEIHHGAWWYDFCSRSNLNGKYFKRLTDNVQGIFWEHWYSFKALRSVQMLIRPKK